MLTSSRPGLNDTEARQLAHAAIGAIHSVLFYFSGLEKDRVVELLTSCARCRVCARRPGREPVPRRRRRGAVRGRGRAAKAESPGRGVTDGGGRPASGVAVSSGATWIGDGGRS